MSKGKFKEQVMLESAGRLPHVTPNLSGNHLRNQDIDVDRIYDLYKTQSKKYVTSKYGIVAGNNSTTAHTHSKYTYIHTLLTPHSCSMFFYYIITF